MTYKALYRKYRPSNYDGLVGQNVIVKTLRNIVKDEKISHAYLFGGPRGTGKTSIAKIFAKAINCLSPIDGNPCDSCEICNLINTEQVSDIIEIDAASNNGVDEIRDLKSKINLAPTTCKFKVYIIDEVHMLSTGAFNALLKTLEEPPRHVVFILATTEIHKLPLTIISRCQNYNFKKITEEQMKIRLDYIIEQEQMKVTPEAIYEIARISDGGMRDSIGLLEQLYSFTDNNIEMEDVELLSSSVSRNDIYQMLLNIVLGKMDHMFKKIDSFYQGGKDFIRIAEDTVVFLKDILLYKKAKDFFKNNYRYDMEEYKDLLDTINEETIYRYITEINGLIGDLRSSTHPKIIFEILMLKLTDVKPSNIELKETEEIKKENIIEVKENIDDVKKETFVEKEVESEETLINEKITPVKSKETEDESDTLLNFVNIPLYKKILINNTLATAQKSLLTELKSKCNQLSTFLINKDFKQAATVLLDGKIVGVSDQCVIWSYQYNVIVEKADVLKKEIEKLIENMFGKKYRIINISDEDWKKIRPHYIKIVKEKKQIEILDEIDEEEIKKPVKRKKKSKEIEEAINIFGEDLIEIK